MDYLQEDQLYPPPPSTLPAYQPDPYDGMPPPPGGEFPDLPALMKACQDHAKQHGYACVTSSNNYKRGIAYVRCDRGGEYVNHWNLTEETRVRKNRTRRLVGCTWKARAKRTAGGTWLLTMMNPKHLGHSASDSPAAHPSQRQLSAEAVEEARQAFKGGMSPKGVLELMRARYNEAITAQDVYNLKAKIARADQKAAAGAVVATAAAAAAAVETTPTTDPTTDPLLQMQMVAPGPNGEATAETCACQCCDH
ncbi:hypothetical protein MMC07_008395 [Pseudocyphellaria aurata]|nr:hypothetical protein [Pseudocyphellaria aurata]